MQDSTIPVTSPRKTLEEDGFAFSTDDFSRCFNSPTGLYFKRDLFINISDQTHGHLHFVGKDYAKKARAGRCDVGITVPEGKNLRFEVTKLALPCGIASLQLYMHTNTNDYFRAAAFCSRPNAEKAHKRLIIPFRTAVVTFSVLRFSSKHVFNLKFSAQSNLNQLERRILSASRGLLL